MSIEKFLEHPLYGQRILHVMSPVRWRGSLFLHETCSNYKVMEKTIRWLPQCHHYVLVPKNNTIPNNRPNVTLIPFDYPGSVTMNRGHFNAKELCRILDFRAIDVDFVFNHQPELAYNILNALQAKRYGGSVKLFNFFEWVETPATKPSDVFPDGYLRQFEAIHLSHSSFFHCEQSVKYLDKNFTKPIVFSGVDKKILHEKVRYAPLAINGLAEPEPFPLPNSVKGKKILVFNHRWNKTTGIHKLVEFTEGLSDEYVVWVTDPSAKKPKSGNPAPAHFHVEGLPFKKYMYLLQKAHATLTFVDGFMTWNLSVQDGIAMKRPTLVYQHPVHKYILGDNYPMYFKSKDDFHKLVSQIPEELDWEMPPHDENFQNNLETAMTDAMSVTGVPDSKYNKQWLYHILEGNEYKQNILYNTHPDLPLSNVMEGIRLYCMQFGVKDDPNSKFTRLFIPNDTIKDKIVNDLNGETFGPSERDPSFVMNAKSDFFAW